MTMKNKILKFLAKNGYKNKAQLVVPSIIVDAAEQLGLSEELEEDDILDIQEESWDILGNGFFE